ncbi:MAG: hypothetical protein ACRCT8_11670 [Lacipirellulaceae bacterium]
MHTIRLRAAWESDSLRGRHTRRFNKPTGIEGGDRVWLACDTQLLTQAGEVSTTLNGHAVTLPRADVTPLLESSNLLELVSKSSLVELLTSVRLEIEATEA